MLRRILSIFLVIFLINNAALKAQNIAPSFEFDAKEAVKWIAMPETQEDAIALPVFINGKKYNAIIDTGSTGTIPFSITDRVRKEMQLTKVSEQKARAYGGRITSDIVQIPTIKVGGMTLENTEATVIPLGFYDGSNVDIVIRQALLRSLLLQVEWDKNRLRLLLTGDSPTTKDQASIIFREGTDQVFTSVGICGSQHDFILDTGLENAISINPRFVSIKDCIGKVRSDIASSGYGGSLTSTLATFPQLTSGSAAFNNIIASLENPNGPLDERDIAGSIGYGLINRSNFIMDIGGGKLQFYGAIRSQHIPQRPTIGLQVSISSNILKITHIMSNSPAENSPLRVGDKICKINDQTIIENEYWTLNPKAENTLSLLLCNGENIKIKAIDFLETHDQIIKNTMQAEIDLNKIGSSTLALGLCEDWHNANISLIKHCTNVINNPQIPDYYKSVARSNRMQLLPYAGRYQEAINDLTSFMREQGETAQILAWRAESRIEIGQINEAMADIDSAIALDANIVAAYIARSSLYYKLGQFSEGLKNINYALTLSPDDSDALSILALGYYYLGDFDRALIAINKSLDIEDEYAENHIIRSEIQKKMGNIERSNIDYQHAYNLSKDESDYAINQWFPKSL